MTQKEFDLQMQSLNVEYTEKSNAIARRKDEANQRKQELITESDDAFHAEKRSRLEKVVQMRKEKAALPDGCPKRDTIEAEARAIEAEISILRDENEQNKRVISKRAYDERCALDDESRQLSEWYAGAKLKVMKIYAEEEQQ